MSYYEDGAIDQFKLPIVHAFGQVAEQTLLAKDFESWAKARAVACGHLEPVQACRVCRGTLKVNDAVSYGFDGVRIFPER